MRNIETPFRLPALCETRIDPEGWNDGILEYWGELLGLWKI
jgi:hypothetical protein